MFRCATCPANTTIFKSAEELEAHIAIKHINHLPYECEICRDFIRFPTEYALTRHYISDHKITEYKIIKNVTRESTEREMKLKAMMHQSLNLPQPAVCAERKRPMLSEDTLLSVPEKSNCLEEMACSSGRGTRMNNPHTEMNEDADAEAHDDIQVKEGACGDNGHEQISFAALLNGTFPNDFSNVANALCTLNPSDGDQSSIMQQLPSSYRVDDLQQTNPPKKKPRPPRSCQMCGLEVAGQRSSFMYHTNTKHLKSPQYSCRVCNKVWTTVAKSDVTKHIKAMHNGDESLITDHRAESAKALKDMTDRCFPPGLKGYLKIHENSRKSIYKCSRHFQDCGQIQAVCLTRCSPFIFHSRSHVFLTFHSRSQLPSREIVAHLVQIIGNDYQMGDCDPEALLQLDDIKHEKECDDDNLENLDGIRQENCGQQTLM